MGDVNPPVGMSPHEKMRLRAAAFRATRVYPGPVGELLSRELLTWEEFGYRLGGESLMLRVIDAVMKTPPPEVVVSMPRNVVGSTAVGYE